MVSSIERFHCIQDSQLGPNGVLYREVPLYTGQPAGPNGVLYREVPLYTVASTIHSTVTRHCTPFEVFCVQCLVCQSFGMKDHAF